MLRRSIVLLFCAAAALAAGLDFRHSAAGRARALDRISRHDLTARFPALPAEVGRRYDPVEAELRVAVALLNLELDRAWLLELEESEARTALEGGPARLAEAAEVARAAWPRRPASWEAAMTLGGATYLELYRGRDPRLMAEPELWERPLVAASLLAPAEPGPLRFLAAAQLGNWSSLPTDQRQAATRLLARAFRDPRTFRLLVADWLRVAPNRRQALGLVPEQPWAWAALERLFARAGDWELTVTARREWHRTLGSAMDRALAEVAIQLRGGERRLARRRLLQLLVEPPLSLDFAPRMTRLLELLPPGPVGRAPAGRFGNWLEWAFDLCLVGECPFEPAVMARLARLAVDLTPSARALALLIAGDLPRAELLERRFAQDRDDRWSAYYLLKARRLAAQGKIELARAELGQVPAADREGLEYRRALRDVSVAQGGDAATEAAADFERRGRSSWEAGDWAQAGGEHRLTLLPDSASTGIALELESLSGRGAVLEVYWDGRLAGIERLARSRSTLEFDLPVSPSLHRLTVRLEAGGPVRPLTARLR